MKRYKIIDLQFEYGGGWWSWTEKTPQTKKQILTMFRGYAEDEGITLPKGKDYNFDFIQDLWECEIVEVKNNY